MSRPRIKNTELPKCVYRKGPSFFLVKKGVWTKLCQNPDQIESALNKLGANPADLTGAALEAYCMKVMVRARCNAKGRRKIEFCLEREDVKVLLERCGGVCSITGMPFRLEIVGERNQRPFAPSIDRIDSMKGYALDNCRIVCVSVNYAMNSWGEQVLKDLFHAWQAKSLSVPAQRITV